MSRKRTPYQERTPGQEPSLESATAVAEPPAMETQAEGQSFAERVGQRKVTFASDPFGIAADYVAGVQLFNLNCLSNGLDARNQCLDICELDYLKALCTTVPRTEFDWDV